MTKEKLSKIANHRYIKKIIHILSVIGFVALLLWLGAIISTIGTILMVVFLTIIVGTVLLISLIFFDAQTAVAISFWTLTGLLILGKLISFLSDIFDIMEENKKEKKQRLTKDRS